jgi:molecular chaperone DnaK
MGAVIGIDLGTTNTVVAAVRDGCAVALPDESGSTLIPSIVSFLPSGAVLVGNAARERRADDVRNTIYSVKRLIGRTWDSPEVTQARSRFPFELREGPGRATFVIGRGETYTLPEISAFVLRKAKSIAELELGEAVDRAVITVPANFNDLQRAATKVAGRVAGLEVLRIINEPTAAALAFGHTPEKTKLLAVYDFGGGTFDFTVMRLTSDVFEVLATAGNTFLGGDDIDTEIAERISDRFIAEDKPDPRETPQGLERVRAAAEHLKVVLSLEPDASIRLDELGIDDAPGVEFLLTRRDLDSSMRPIIEKTFAVCRDALTSAKLSAKDLDDVLLVGGSTKDSYVRKRVTEFFGKPARFDVDPHEVVALGAARQAEMLTHAKASRDEIAIPAPPMVAARSGATDEATGGEFRQKTQPFGRTTTKSPDWENARRVDEEKPPLPLVSSREDLPAPAKLKVVPPEGPISYSVPNTRDIAQRERKTTGLGLGPSQSNPETSLPLVGQGSHSPVEARQKTPTPLDVQQPPSTLNGLGPKDEKPKGEPRSTDAALPATKPAPTSPLGRSPAMRVTGGFGSSPKPNSDLTDTLTSVQFQSEATLNTPIEALPARSPTTKNPNTGPFGTSPTFGNQNAPPAFAAAGQLPGRRPIADNPSDWEPLPAPIESKPTTNTKLTPSFDAPLENDKANQLSSDIGDDDPTVVRRNQLDLDELFAQAEALTNPPESQTSSQPNVKRAGRPASLNEEEIRARYGNLPLIVGGKRVGAASPQARGQNPLQPLSPNQREEKTQQPKETTSLERPDLNLGAMTRQLTQLVAPDTKTTVGKAITLEPEALDLDAFEPDFSPQGQSEDSSDTRNDRLVPGRFASSHPAARPDVELESELPIPDLPPLSTKETADTRLDLESSDYDSASRSNSSALTSTLVSPSRDWVPSSSSNAAKSGAYVQQNNVKPAPPQPQVFAPPQPQVFAPPQPQVFAPPQPQVFAPPQPQVFAPPQPQVFAPPQPQVFAPPQPQVFAQPRPSNSSATTPNIVPPRTPPFAPAIPHNQVEATIANVGNAGTTSSGTVSSLFQSPPASSKRPPGPILLIDVTPHSLCVETAGGYADILVSRNTPVPCERTRDFVTVQDNQDTVVVRVAQGESQQFHENALLGEVQLTRLPLAPRGQTRVSITFGLDSDGMLHVRALDVATGQTAVSELQLVAAPSSPEVRQMIARQKKN